LLLYDAYNFLSQGLIDSDLWKFNWLSQILNRKFNKNLESCYFNFEVLQLLRTKASFIPPLWDECDLWKPKTDCKWLCVPYDDEA